MNDKNFIEELRQKREEYGVTQTRLAVACGISREYYNRIEKGKQPLNDELREVIEKQIERFNPQEPLFLLIDYFRVRFPTTDALAIIRDVLQLKSNYMLYEDYGKYGYESKYVLGDINIMCSMQEHLGVLLELKGKGCRQMECYLLAQERSWYDFMLDCMTAGGVMKRLDLADYSGTLRATCPDFESHHSGEWEPYIPVIQSHLIGLYYIYFLYTVNTHLWCEYR